MDYEALASALERQSGTKRKGNKFAKAAPLKSMAQRTRMAQDAPAPRTHDLIAERGSEPVAEALRAWNDRVNGVPIVDVAHQLGVGLELAKKLIKEAHQAITEDLKENLDLNRQLDLARVDGLIHTFYPMAREGDYEAAAVTIRALGHRSKLTGIEPLPDPGRSHPQGVLIWLQQSLPSINRIVDSLPTETIELPPG